MGLMDRFRGTVERLGEKLNAEPETYQWPPDRPMMAALAGADMVLAGQHTRAQFDQSMEQSVRMGHLHPEDLQAALAKLDR